MDFWGASNFSNILAPLGQGVLVLTTVKAFTEKLGQIRYGTKVQGIEKSSTYDIMSLIVVPRKATQGLEDPSFVYTSIGDVTSIDR